MTAPTPQVVDDALAVAAKGISGFVNLSPSQKAYYRLLLENDPFVFLYAIAGFRDLVPRFHQPLAYLLGGCALRLQWVLNNPKLKSEVITQIKQEMNRFVWRDPDGKRRRGIDWTNPKHVIGIDRFCDFIEVRIARGFFKTSVGIGTNAWDITRNPNVTTLMVHGVDKQAWKMNEQIGGIIQSDVYRAIWPDRIPDSPKTEITQSAIWLKGRTVPHLNACIEAYGHQSNTTGSHYDKFYFDDLVTEDMSQVEIEKAVEYLDRIESLSINVPGTRVRRIHIGTRYNESDDSSKLAHIEECIHITVPIEIHDEPITMATIRKPGRPTLEEVWSAEKIAALKERKINDPDPRALLNLLWNQYLTPNAHGDEFFPASLLNRQQFQITTDEKTGRAVIERQDRDRYGQPIFLDESGQPATAEQGGKPKLIHVDTAGLRYVLGVDPAVSSSSSADEWAVSCLATDYQGVMYQMETRAGKGWQSMLETMSLMDKKWGYPAKIGIEKAGSQILILELIQRDERYRRMASRTIPVVVDSTTKDDKIQAHVVNKLQMADLYLNALDADTRKEMRMCQRGKSKNRKDGRIDSIVIAVMCVVTPAIAQTDAEIQKNETERQRRYKSSLDPMTGTPIYDWAIGDF